MNGLHVLRKSIRLLPVTLLTLLIYSCEEPVDLGFEVVESQLAVSSAFFPGESVKVYLSATQPTVGEQVFSEITDATVSILEGNDTREVLRYVAGQNGRRGSYQSTEFKPVVGRYYTLFVTKSGYKPVEATSSIPEPVQIMDLEILGDIDRKTIDGINVYSFSLKINYDDPEYIENLYDIRVSQLVTPYYLNATGDTVLLETNAKVVRPLYDKFAGNTEYGETSILVRDLPTPDGFVIDLQSRFDPKKEILGNLVAELRTVSEAYFLYQLKIQQEQQALPIGLGDPSVTSFGNVQQGVGVFAGYNRDIWQFSFAD